VAKSYVSFYAQPSGTGFSQESGTLCCETEIDFKSMPISGKRPDFSSENHRTPCHLVKPRIAHRHARTDRAVSTESAKREQIKQRVWFDSGQVVFHFFHLQKDYEISKRRESRSQPPGLKRSLAALANLTLGQFSTDLSHFGSAAEKSKRSSKKEMA